MPATAATAMTAPSVAVAGAHPRRGISSSVVSTAARRRVRPSRSGGGFGRSPLVGVVRAVSTGNDAADKKTASSASKPPLGDPRLPISPEAAAILESEEAKQQRRLQRIDNDARVNKGARELFAEEEYVITMRETKPTEVRMKATSNGITFRVDVECEREDVENGDLTIHWGCVTKANPHKWCVPPPSIAKALPLGTKTLEEACQSPLQPVSDKELDALGAPDGVRVVKFAIEGPIEDCPHMIKFVLHDEAHGQWYHDPGNHHQPFEIPCPALPEPEMEEVDVIEISDAADIAFDPHQSPTAAAAAAAAPTAEELAAKAAADAMAQEELELDAQIAAINAEYADLGASSDSDSDADGEDDGAAMARIEAEVDAELGIEEDEIFGSEDEDDALNAEEEEEDDDDDDEGGGGGVTGMAALLGQLSSYTKPDPAAEEEKTKKREDARAAKIAERDAKKQERESARAEAIAAKAAMRAEARAKREEAKAMAKKARDALKKERAKEKERKVATLLQRKAAGKKTRDAAAAASAAATTTPPAAAAAPVVNPPDVNNVVPATPAPAPTPAKSPAKSYMPAPVPKKVRPKKKKMVLKVPPPPVEVPWHATHEHKALSHTDVDVVARVGVRVETEAGSMNAACKVRVETDLPVDSLLLHWGVVPRGARQDQWALPSPQNRPEGTKEYGDGKAVQTAMKKVSGGLASDFGYVELDMGAAPVGLRFCLKENGDKNRWFDNRGGDFYIKLPETTALSSQLYAGGPPVRASDAAGVANMDAATMAMGNAAVAALVGVDVDGAIAEMMRKAALALEAAKDAQKLSMEATEAAQEVPANREANTKARRLIAQAVIAKQNAEAAAVEAQSAADKAKAVRDAKFDDLAKVAQDAANEKANADKAKAAAAENDLKQTMEIDEETLKAWRDKSELMLTEQAVTRAGELETFAMEAQKQRIEEVERERIEMQRRAEEEIAARVKAAEEAAAAARLAAETRQEEERLRERAKIDLEKQLNAIKADDAVKADADLDVLASIEAKLLELQKQADAAAPPAPPTPAPTPTPTAPAAPKTPIPTGVNIAPPSTGVNIAPPVVYSDFSSPPPVAEVPEVVTREVLQTQTQTETAVPPPARIGERVQQPTGTGQEILLQGFNWESCRVDGGRAWYQRVTTLAPKLKEMGITVIWLPPPTNSVSQEGYMPSDLYDLDSWYGSKEELKRCIDALHENGIKALGDAVLNHRCAQFQGPDGLWNRYGGKLDWDARAIVKDDPHFGGQGNHSSGDFFHAAPNVDHSQDFVKRDICTWMQWMQAEVGYDGWRLDYVRGFSGKHVADYMKATDVHFAVGEFWDTLAYNYDEPAYNQDDHRQRIVSWMDDADATAGAFDVTTKGILHAVFERQEYWRLADTEGKPPGVVGRWPSRAVTFIENHDTGSTQGHWRFPEGFEMQGYAYIMTHPGTPTIFWDHLFEWPELKQPLLDLIKLRKEVGIKCRSGVKILCAEQAVYAAEIFDEGENGEPLLIMKIGPNDWAPEDQTMWEYAMHGDQWCVWRRRRS